MAYLITFTLLVFAISTPALGASKGKDRSNCKVELVKEASAGSISISFEADDQDDCERARGGDVQISYSGENTPKAKAPPQKKKQ